MGTLHRLNEAGRRQWIISGDVLNPVSGFELITYDAMDWFMGVGSVDDMMAPVKTQSSWVSKLNLGQETYPAWTQYFECMVDDDQLQEDLAMGRKVPYELYNVLQFCDSCDYSKAEACRHMEKAVEENAWRYMSIQSLLAILYVHRLSRRRGSAGEEYAAYVLPRRWQLG